MWDESFRSETNLLIISTLSDHGANVALSASIHSWSYSNIYTFLIFSITASEKLPSAAPMSARTSFSPIVNESVKYL